MFVLYVCAYRSHNCKSLYDIAGFIQRRNSSLYKYLHICLCYTICAYRKSKTANLYMILPASYRGPTRAFMCAYRNSVSKSLYDTAGFIQRPNSSLYVYLHICLCLHKPNYKSLYDIDDIIQSQKAYNICLFDALQLCKGMWLWSNAVVQHCSIEHWFQIIIRCFRSNIVAMNIWFRSLI